MSVEHAESGCTPGAVPVSQEVANRLLKSVVRNCKAQRVLFDLDSTLLNNRPRSAVIMREFASTCNHPLLLRATPAHFPTWSARDSMVLLGLSQEVADSIIDEYMDFWESRFFTSEYCQYDEVILGAVNFVNAVHNAGGLVNYLTGRDETMRQGTSLSLQTLGFPDPCEDKVELMMKPVASDSDDLFKDSVLRTLSAEGGILAAFDNEPSHINSYRTVFPDAICVHLDTDNSMRDIALIGGIVSIRNFVF